MEERPYLLFFFFFFSAVWFEWVMSYKESFVRLGKVHSEGRFRDFKTAVAFLMAWKSKFGS